MIFQSTKLEGLFVIEPELKSDERGFFARTWCATEFGEHGLNPNLAQCNISFNHKAGTLRGLHFQVAPHAEAKLVRCTMGAIWDIAVDVRPASKTFGEWHALEISAQNRRQFYIPEGFAHGFQTLQDNSEVFYQMSEFFHPECSFGVRWDDPTLNVEWPGADRIISQRDRELPSLAEVLAILESPVTP